MIIPYGDGHFAFVSPSILSSGICHQRPHTPNPPVPQVYAISINAKDCRLVCTNLNMAQGEDEEERAQQHFMRCSDNDGDGVEAANYAAASEGRGGDGGPFDLRMEGQRGHQPQWQQQQHQERGEEQRMAWGKEGEGEVRQGAPIQSAAMTAARDRRTSSRPWDAGEGAGVAGSRGGPGPSSWGDYLCEEEEQLDAGDVQDDLAAVRAPPCSMPRPGPPPPPRAGKWSCTCTTTLQRYASPPSSSNTPPLTSTHTAPPPPP